MKLTYMTIAIIGAILLSTAANVVVGSLGAIAAVVGLLSLYVTEKDESDA